MEKVIGRVKSLLALAKSDNPNEATAAMCAAQRLIDQHRLTVAEIEAKTKQVKEHAEFFDEPLCKGKLIANWKIRLASVLAVYNGCDTLTKRSHQKLSKRLVSSEIVIVGRLSDVQNVRFLFAWGLVEIQKISKRHCKGKGRKYYNSWYNGVVTGIDRQLERHKSSLEQMPVSQMALTRLDDRLNEAKELINKMFRVDINKSKLKCLESAYRNGIEAGENMNLPTKKSLP
jgi:hypothetical protein